MMCERVRVTTTKRVGTESEGSFNRRVSIFIYCRFLASPVSFGLSLSLASSFSLSGFFSTLSLFSLSLSLSQEMAAVNENGVGSDLSLITRFRDILLSGNRILRSTLHFTPHNTYWIIIIVEGIHHDFSSCFSVRISPPEDQARINFLLEELTNHNDLPRDVDMGGLTVSTNPDLVILFFHRDEHFLSQVRLTFADSARLVILLEEAKAQYTHHHDSRFQP